VGISLSFPTPFPHIKKIFTLDFLAHFIGRLGDYLGHIPLQSPLSKRFRHVSTKGAVVDNYSIDPAEPSILDARYKAGINIHLGDLHPRRAEVGRRSLQELQHCKNAQSSYQLSLGMWHHISDPGVAIPFAPLGFSCRWPKTIVKC
jgi:hypothetical protein